MLDSYALNVISFYKSKTKANSGSDNIQIRSCMCKQRSIEYSCSVLMETSLIAQLNFV